MILNLKSVFEEILKMEGLLDSTGKYLNPNFSMYLNGNFTDFTIVTDNGDIPVSGLPADKVVVPVLFFILILFGVSTNSVALTFMYKRRKKFQVTDIFLLNHFISNILFLSVFVPFIAVAYGITDWIFGHIGCKLVNYGMTLCLAASLLTVTVACLHHSLGYGCGHTDKTTVRHHCRAKVMISVIWIVAGVTMIPRVFLYSTVRRWHIIDERLFCTRRQGAAIYRQVDTCLTCLSLYVIPLLVQAACHIRAFRDLKKLASSGQNLCPRQTVAKVLAGISAAILIGWLPTHIINFSEDFAADKGGDPLLFKHREVVAYGFSYVAMSATPLVYYIFQRRLRMHHSYAVSANDALIVDKSAQPLHDIESGDALIADSLEFSRQKTTSL